jgi:hypothetical protein
MKTIRCVTACVALLSLAAAHGRAQMLLSPGANYFADPPARKRPGPANTATMKEYPPVPVNHYSQVLVFDDGSEFRGELLAVTKDDVVWQREDANAPLRFPRRTVRRIVTATAIEETRRAQRDNLAANERIGPPQPRTPAKPEAATVKLPAGDWLFGDVASADGKTIRVSLGNGGGEWPIDRSRIEWLQFSKAPAPAFGFSGSVLDIGGWLPASASLELANGTLTVKGSHWIARTMAPMKRFEILLELPENCQDGIRLWLQPSMPLLHYYDTGTVQIGFGKQEISHVFYTGDMQSEPTPLPPETVAGKGPVTYRIFYDDPAKRLHVFRNGRQVADWQFTWKKEDVRTAAGMKNHHFTGLTLERVNGDQNDTSLQINRLCFQPWDGQLPGEEGAGERDRLDPGAAGPLSGKLEAIDEKEVIFSGAPQPRQQGACIRLAGTKSDGLVGADAKISIGQSGEFSVRHLQIHDGRVDCETAFASAFTLPQSAVRTLHFPTAPIKSAAGADVLVFKNGDELRGKALAASLRGPVRWRTVQGQEVEFQAERIAGVLLAGGQKDKNAGDAAPMAMVELRDGERLPGRLATLDENQLRLEHPQLGALALDRTHIWHLFPNAKLGSTDGGREAGDWDLVFPNHNEDGSPTSADDGQAYWFYLNGTYIHRRAAAANVFGNDDPEWHDGTDHAFERFEFRVQTSTVIDPASPNSWNDTAVFIFSDDQGASVGVSLSHTNVQVSVVDPKVRNRDNWHSFPFKDLVPNDGGPQALRLFVDTKAGTTDVMVNGVHVAHLGRDANDRVPKSDYHLRFQPYPSAGSTTFSDFWLGPWNGELPKPGEPTRGTTTLANGDVIPAISKTIRDGKLAVDSDLGELTIPVEKVLAMDFGGGVESTPAPGRIRLADGAVLNANDFRWDEQGVSVHSPSFGELHLPANAVAELVYGPTPAHALIIVDPKNPKPASEPARE